MEVVQVKDLNFSYEFGFELKDISFTVQSGEVVVLLGPNGCGKTTLLKCVNALLKPTSGSVLIEGRDVSRMGMSDLARYIGYVPQVHTPPFPYSVSDVVLMGRASYLSIFQQPSRSDYAKSEEALELVGLSSLRDRPYTQISGGERQLVLIARAIAQEPKLLLLDEPTAHLDFKNQFMVLRMVRKVAEEKGIGVLMSLHDPNHAMRFSDRIVLINSGKILSVGKPDDVISPQSIMELYSMETDVLDHEGKKLVVPVF